MPESPRSLLSEAQRTEYLRTLPDWTLVHEHLERWFEFASFEQAVGFVNATAEIAEEMDHHPDIDVRYRRVRLSFTTHSAGGLTLLDTQSAARTEQAARNILQVPPLHG